MASEAAGGRTEEDCEGTVEEREKDVSLLKLHHLPPELLLEICLRLESVVDLLSLRATCHALCSCASANAVWRSLYGQLRSGALGISDSSFDYSQPNHHDNHHKLMPSSTLSCTSSTSQTLEISRQTAPRHSSCSPVSPCSRLFVTAVEEGQYFTKFRDYYTQLKSSRRDVVKSTMNGTRREVQFLILELITTQRKHIAQLVEYQHAIIQLEDYTSREKSPAGDENAILQRARGAIENLVSVNKSILTAYYRLARSADYGDDDDEEEEEDKEVIRVDDGIGSDSIMFSVDNIDFARDALEQLGRSIEKHLELVHYAVLRHILVFEQCQLIINSLGPTVLGQDVTRAAHFASPRPLYHLPRSLVMWKKLQRKCFELRVEHGRYMVWVEQWRQTLRGKKNSNTYATTSLPSVLEDPQQGVDDCSEWKLPYPPPPLPSSLLEEYISRTAECCASHNTVLEFKQTSATHFSTSLATLILSRLLRMKKYIYSEHVRIVNISTPCAYTVVTRDSEFILIAFSKSRKVTREQDVLIATHSAQMSKASSSQLLSSSSSFSPPTLPASLFSGLTSAPSHVSYRDTAIQTSDSQNSSEGQRACVSRSCSTWRVESDGREWRSGMEIIVNCSLVSAFLCDNES